MKFCYECCRWRPVDAFRPHKGSCDGRIHTCHYCELKLWAERHKRRYGNADRS